MKTGDILIAKRDYTAAVEYGPPNSAFLAGEEFIVEHVWNHGVSIRRIRTGTLYFGENQWLLQVFEKVGQNKIIRNLPDWF